MTDIECGNCGHEWTYTGEKPAGTYTNCPTCMHKVQIPDD